MKVHRERSAKHRSGFSLVEVLIALGIFSLALSVVFLILKQSVSRIERIQSQVFTILRVQQFARKEGNELHYAWGGPELVCKEQNDPLKRYKRFQLECDGSQGVSKAHTIIPNAYLEWGEF